MRSSYCRAFSNRRHRPRFASCHARVLTLRQSLHSPEREGASRRMLAIPSRPRCSATRSNAKPSSKGSDSKIAGQPKRSSRARRHAWRSTAAADEDHGR